LHEEKTRKTLINNLKTEIAAKDQQIRDLKAKIESQKLRQEEIERSFIKPSVDLTQEPMLTKLASEIDTIKEYVSGKKTTVKEQELDEFVEMENFDSEGEEDKHNQKINKLKQLKAEVADLKKEIKTEQDIIQSKKAKWKENFNYLKDNYTSDIEDKKKKLINEKAEIDSIIKVLNRKVEIYKAKEKRVKELESELESHLNENIKQKPERVRDSFFIKSHKFPDIESVGHSNDFN